MDQNISVIVMLIGLAVGVDYSMFYLKREREERRRGLGERAALEAAAATSGRAVLISGLTVMVAMAGMLFTGDKTFESFGVATMIVVGVAVLGSLTVLPALLSKLGDKVDKVRIPFLSRRRRERSTRVASGTPCSTGSCATRCCRASAPARCSLALATPALQMHTVTPGPETFPKSIPVMKVYDEMQKSFPGGSIPAVVMIKTGDASADPGSHADRRSCRRQAVATGEFNEPTSVIDQPQRHHRARVAPDRGLRHRLRVDPRARDAA